MHPFDDADVIAGQGTVGIEIVKKLSGKPIDAVFVCVGGGGLLAGISAAIKALRPEVRVIGVEADDAAGMTTSLASGRVCTLPSVGLFADGAAVKTVGRETFNVCSQLVDEMITVSNDEICAAIKLGFNDTRCVLEPAGALAIAGMMKYSKANKNPSRKLQFVAVSSGANMDFDRLRFVSERADASEYLMAVGIPEKPGSFKCLYDLIKPRNVTEFSYRAEGKSQASVFMSVQALPESSLEEDRPKLIERLNEEGYRVTDLSSNEMAKAHARHLAGGRPKGECRRAEGTIEVVYRFEFPEAPGALDKFLDTLQLNNPGWDISLFHYRNHGHDFGRVLVGLLVDEKSKGQFDTFLEKLDYTFYEETHNEAYEIFLK